MPRALTHCGRESWKSELRVESANIHAAPPEDERQGDDGGDVDVSEDAVPPLPARPREPTDRRTPGVTRALRRGGNTVPLDGAYPDGTQEQAVTP